jgi:N-acetylmuramic acid 6-phosphate etherase
MLTEGRNPRSENLDQLPTLDVLALINDEDASVARVVRDAMPEIARAVDVIVPAMQKGGRLIYVGAGTSGRLGILDAAECVPTFGLEPGVVIGLIAGGESALIRAAEGAEDRSEDGRGDLVAINLTGQDVVIGIAASGRTPYVLGAVNYAHEMGCVTVGIACNQPSILLDQTDIKIGLPTGPEVLTGSTRLKAGTAQKMTLNMISTAVMVKLGKVYGNRMIDLMVTNEKLADRACRIVSEIAGIPYDEAARLLDLTGKDVKLAIVVAVRHVTPDEARAMLAEAGDNLRSVIG